MRRISALFFAILFCSAMSLFAQTPSGQNDKPAPAVPKEQAKNSTKPASAGGDFQDAGKQITTEYGQGGKAVGHGGKEHRQIYRGEAPGPGRQRRGHRLGDHRISHQGLRRLPAHPVAVL